MVLVWKNSRVMTTWLSWLHVIVKRNLNKSLLLHDSTKLLWSNDYSDIIALLCNKIRISHLFIYLFSAIDNTACYECSISNRLEVLVDG